MATDYKKIAEEHERRYGWDAKPRRIYKKLYSDKTHFIYELIQNADDSGSKHLKLQLDSNALLVWNDGCRFKEKDVRSICSLGSSDKDLTDIGTFGIGFKAVYNYTDLPEIYSGCERFRIRDFIKPEGIDEMSPEIKKLVEEGKTVFRLPFKGNRHQAEDIEHLKDRLCNLSKERPLLFLRHLERIEWKDERNAQTGFYFSHRHSYDKIQDVPDNESIELVNLTGSLGYGSELSETFLVLRKKIHLSEDVIDKLLEQAEDEEDKEEQQRIQRSAEELQPIEVAFKLQDDRITAMDDNCVLFAYLPTEKETHLKFLIQARYQTTPARDNIPKPSENPWNKWLVKETADYLPEILEQLKTGGLLELAFFNVLPLKGEVENEFKPIAEAAKKAMREKLLVPTEDDGYAKAENVFYPHHGSLRKLVESSWLYPNSSWLHTDIGRSGRAFDIMKEAGVKEINVSHVLNWLEKQDLNWFENRCEKWLCSLYIYLNNQKSQLERINGLERIKKMPLIRLENGQHVCSSNELAFFPPETDEAREEISPFLNDLPILQSTLLEVEDDDIKSFLDRVDVKTLHPEKLIREWMIPQYSQPDKPSKKENISHVRYLFNVWDKLAGHKHRDLKEKIRTTPILQVRNSISEDNLDFVAPYNAYLPQAYMGDGNLETYFSVYNGDIWFVDDTYMETDSNTENWLQFLKAIGAMDTPQVIKKNIPAVYGNAQEFDKELDNRNIKGLAKRSTWLLKTKIEDFYLHGLSEILAEISEHKRVNLSQVCWSLLVKVLPSGQKARDAFFQGIYHRYYYSNRSDPFDATFYRQLKETAWLPDEQGNLHRPSECFAPTSENRRVLGDSVVYLHPNFDIGQDDETAQWLADKLGIHLKAKTENVMNYLRTLSNTKVSMEKVEPLYHFLDRQDARRSEEFKKNSLIFTPNPESCWWQVDEVFWEDKSGVLESARRCLKAHYPAMLKTFFINLGVSEQASQRDYACHIQEIATTEQAGNEKVRERVQQLYKCLHAWSDEWKIIYDNRCWLGKEGGEWKFFTRQELALKDHPHIGELFEGEVPFWAFDGDLSSLARNLKVERCSQAEFEFYPDGKQAEDPDWSEKVRNLRLYIYAFLNSPRLYKESDISKELEGGKRAEVLDQLSVCRVQELKVTYKLKGISLPDPNPRQSFLDVTDQKVTLWVGLEVDKSEYAELIGDALQDHFGAKELGRFVEDLLTPAKKQDRVLSNWKRKGLETKFLDEDPKDNEKKQIEPLDEKFPDESNSGGVDFAADESDMRIPTDNETPKTDGEDNKSLTDKTDESEIHLSSNGDSDWRTDEPEIETPTDGETTDIDKSNNSSTADEPESPTNPVSDIQGISSRNTQSLTKADSNVTQSVKGEPESETPTVHEDPETKNENNDSTENESVASVYPSRSGGSRARSREGKGINTPSGNRGTGHSSGRNDGTEENTHMEETGTSAQARKEVEDAGMKHAHRYEKKEGRTPKDVSSERHRGYDIYSTSPDGKNRCIEVKARDNHAFVVLTSNEWSVAKQLKDNYFLYVVLNARTQPELYIIRNPTDVVSPIQDIRYQVPLSEITEHGIRV